MQPEASDTVVPNEGSSHQVPFVPSAELIKGEFTLSSSLVTFSRFSTTIGEDNKSDEFVQLMSDLQKRDEAGQKHVIWALDFGSPHRANESALDSGNAYKNFKEFCDTCRKASRELDGDWFNRRSAFFIQCNDADILKRYYLPKRLNPNKSILKNIESSKIFNFSSFNLKDDSSTEAVTAFSNNEADSKIKYFKHRAGDNGQPVAISLEDVPNLHDSLVRKFVMAARLMNGESNFGCSDDIFLELLNANFLTCNFEEFVKFEQKLRNNTGNFNEKLEA